MESETTRDEGGEVVLALAGSFFPLHEGHIEVLRAGKLYCETTLGRSVAYGVLIPSPWASLCRKFSDIGDQADFKDDPRTMWAQAVLDTSKATSAWIRWQPPALSGGIAEACRRAGCEAGSERKLIQVCGTDNQIRATLRDKTFGDVIVVVDSRGIPEENKELLAAGNIAVTRTTSNTCYMSSTIERLWHALWEQRQGTKSLLSLLPSKPFDPTWLTDTGVNLGSGRQGIVRLMTLGSRPVAVKWLARGGKYDTFDIEGPLWEHMRGSGLCPEPIVIGTTEAFGYIVTEVGVPINAILNVNYDYNWKTVGEVLRKPASKSKAAVESSLPEYPFLQGKHKIQLVPAFDALAAVPSWPPKNNRRSSTQPLPAAETRVEVEDPVEPPSQSVLNVVEALNHIRIGVADVVKQQSHFGVYVVNQIRHRILPLLRQLEIIHRDPKIENMIMFPDGSIRLCDFSVGKMANDPTRIARGKLIMYPPRAVNVASFYDYTCDEYFASMSSFEALTLRQVYGDHADDVQVALQLKARGELPRLPDDFWEHAENQSATKEINDQLEWIRAVWEAHVIRK